MNEVGINSLVEGMLRYVGQTVTIFTTSGGLSGSGFTGVLVFVDSCTVRLLVEMGWPPSCPIGSACTGPIGDNYSGCGFGYGYGNFNPLGAICEIPVDGTKYTLFVRLCSGAFQEFARHGDLQRSRDKGLSFVKRIEAVA